MDKDSKKTTDDASQTELDKNSLEYFCRDMPEQQPYNEAEDPEMIEHPEIKGLWLNMKIPLSVFSVRILMVQFHKNPPLRKRIFEDWYNLHPQKKLFVKELNKYVRINGSISVIDAIIDNHRTRVVDKQDSTQPQGLPCLPEFADKLKPIFKELKDAGLIHKTVKESDFVKAFQAGALIDWKPIRWTGSNPAVSTLVNRMTGLKAVPALVNQLFITNTPYDSNSGNRVNEDIKAILKRYN